MRFAYARHATSINDRVFAWVDGVLAEGEQPCVLLDGSMFEPDDIQRLQRRSILLQPALIDTPYESYGLQGPLLWILETPYRESLTLLLRRTDGIPALSFIAPRQGLEALHKALAWLASARTEDGQTLHCRFADTRMLLATLDTLSSKQKNIPAIAIKEWIWIARDGNLQSRSFPARIDNALDGPDSLALDSTQFAKMIVSAEPDMVFQMLAEKMSDVLPDEPPHVTHQRLSNLLDTARGYGIVDLPDLFQYAVVGLSTRDDFDQHPAVRDSWPRVKRDSLRFSELADQWSADVWHSLQQQSPPARPS